MQGSNLSIGTRLGAGFAGAIVLLVAVAALGVNRITAVSQSTEIILHDRFAKVALSHTIENEVNKQSLALRMALIAKDAEGAKTELLKIEESIPRVNKAVEALKASVRTEKGSAALNAMLAARSAFKDHEYQLTEMIKSGQVDAAREYLAREMLRPQAEYLSAIHGFAKTQTLSMEEFGLEAASSAATTKALMMGLAALAAALGIATAIYLTRSITRPIGEAVKIAKTVATGDLTMDIGVNSTDETGQLLAALKTMATSLSKVVSVVRSAGESIATGAQEIASGNTNLSQRTEAQASNLQQTAASMEQLSSTVKHSADTSRQASELATMASAVAQKGGEVVGQVVATMDDITSSSKKIAQIIGVIDGIAFQTNILALNAAVEAARAGEQGRGFAVVASEVRNLAQRSAEAAREIKTLIGASVDKVEIGSQQVGNAGATMNDIVAQVRKVTALIADISSATVEQTAGIGQVGDAVNQLDQVTQQNAALVEESAAAAESLRQQAGKLVAAVSVFKIDSRVGAFSA